MGRSKERSKEMTDRHEAPEHTNVRCLPGVVYGSEGAPLADALIRLPTLNRTTRTGKFGEFQLEILPTEDLSQLEIEAAGREITVDLNTVEVPIAIHFVS
jgi:hypothetical protein